MRPSIPREIGNGISRDGIRHFFDRLATGEYERKTWGNVLQRQSVQAATVPGTDTPDHDGFREIPAASSKVGLLTFNGAGYFKDVTIRDRTGAILWELDLSGTDVDETPAEVIEVSGNWVVKLVDGEKVLAQTTNGNGSFYYAVLDVPTSINSARYVFDCKARRTDATNPADLMGQAVHVQGVSDEVCHYWYVDDVATTMVMRSTDNFPAAAGDTWDVADIQADGPFPLFPVDTWRRLRSVVEGTSMLFYYGIETAADDELQQIRDWVYGSSPVLFHEWGKGEICGLWFANDDNAANPLEVELWVDGVKEYDGALAYLFHVYPGRELAFNTNDVTVQAVGENSGYRRTLHIPYTTEVKLVAKNVHATLTQIVWSQVETRQWLGEGNPPYEAHFELVEGQSVAVGDWERFLNFDPKKPGFLWSVYMHLSAPDDITFLEGDVHLVPDDKDAHISTGTEDFFKNSFYWQNDHQQNDEVGMTDLDRDGTPAYIVGAYRNFHPPFALQFERNLKGYWHNGEFNSASPGVVTFDSLVIAYTER